MRKKRIEFWNRTTLQRIKLQTFPLLTVSYIYASNYLLFHCNQLNNNPPVYSRIAVMPKMCGINSTSSGFYCRLQLQQIDSPSN